MDEFPARFGKRQNAAGFKYALKLSDDFFMLHDMVKTLIAEDHVE
jgi:hypothetical protein